jgi:hypothetical protein
MTRMKSSALKFALVTEQLLRQLDTELYSLLEVSDKTASFSVDT